jgi:hypothetical protein
VFLKGILPGPQVFQGGCVLCVLQIGLFSWVEGTYVVLEAKLLMLQPEPSSQLLSWGIALGFGRNTS